MASSGERTTHSHIKFYDNSLSTALGGVQVTPSITFGTPSAAQTESVSAEQSRLDVDRVRVINYLMTLPANTKATILDIQRELGIDLQFYRVLVEQLKNTEKIEYGHDNDGSLYFQYRHKYVIENKHELLQLLQRVGHGVLLSEVENCYPLLRADVADMVRGGLLIAARNKDKKTLVLYSRGTPFLSELSADTVARPREQQVSTSVDITNEIRRGEALRVGKFWYRVSTMVQGDAQGKLQRAAAPPSVTLDADLSDRNVYVLPFGAESVPLDGEFEEREEFRGRIVKHGATNDVKDFWRQTATQLRPFQDNELGLVNELVRLKLIHDGSSQAFRKPHVAKEKQSKQRKQREKKAFQAFGTNDHLRGSFLEAKLRASQQRPQSK